jgi:hypothetical protein
VIGQRASSAPMTNSPTALALALAGGLHPRPAMADDARDARGPAGPHTPPPPPKKPPKGVVLGKDGKPYVAVFA